MENNEFFRRMRRLIGRRCVHLGRRCLLVDVLADEGSLVVRCEEGMPPIQSDQFGQALRRAEELRTVDVLDETGDHLTPEMLDLLATLEAKAA